jgi:hypothetical protein
MHRVNLAPNASVIAQKISGLKLPATSCRESSILRVDCLSYSLADPRKLRGMHSLLDSRNEGTI